MVTNLKSKLKHPISISCLLLVLGMVISIGLCQTSLVQKIAEQSYLSSATFMTTLAELTTYLKQAKIENQEIYYKKYERLENLIYYIESQDGGDTKVITNDIDSNGEEQRLKDSSKFYMNVTFNDAYNYLTQCSLSYNSNAVMDFQSAFRAIIKKGKIGRDSEELGYKNLEVSYYILNKPLSKGDFIYENVEQYKPTARLKIFMLVYAILTSLYLLFLIIICYRRRIKEKSWRIFEEISIEIKLMIALMLCIGGRTIYWELIQPNALMRILYGNIGTKVYWGSIYMIGGIILICAMTWYIVDIAFLIRNNGLKLIREKSLMIKHKEKLLHVVGYVYSMIGIDLTKVSYVKLYILNLVHIIALIFMARVAWQSEWDGLMIAIIYGGIACIGVLGLIWDFNNMKKQVMRMRPNAQIERIKFPYMRVLLELGTYLIALFFLDILGYESELLGLILALAIGMLVWVWSTRYVNGYSELYQYVKEIRLGRTSQKPTTSFLSPIIEELSLVDEGLQHAISQELISQRMKTELISNVSHDLKTPLTSIINYVDLLKKEDLTKEQQQEYIRILDRKSQRLKVLIEDLFEASKTASGNIELIKEEIDLVALLKQTLGEMQEKISGSGLQFKVNVPEEKVICELDGRRTYRIFENLIGNILKYAQPHSRVYINCMVEEEVSIIFRNISAYEMDFSAQEITERFKRGDKSRHTEGSGLGLAIAKNLTELQDGKLDIIIDGDLFKVIVKFSKKN